MIEQRLFLRCRMCEKEIPWSHAEEKTFSGVKVFDYRAPSECPHCKTSEEFLLVEEKLAGQQSGVAEECWIDEQGHLRHFWKEETKQQ